MIEDTVKKIVAACRSILGPDRLQTR